MSKKTDNVSGYVYLFVFLALLVGVALIQVFGGE
jgi:hypothetical protein